MKNTTKEVKTKNQRTTKEEADVVDNDDVKLMNKRTNVPSPHLYCGVMRN